MFDQLPLPGVSEPISVSSARILLQDRDREKPDDIGFDHNKQMLRLFFYSFLFWLSVMTDYSEVSESHQQMLRMSPVT